MLVLLKIVFENDAKQGLLCSAVLHLSQMVFVGWIGFFIFIFLRS